MKATILDLRHRMGDVLRALDRNETVKIFYRGRLKALLLPAHGDQEENMSVKEHPAFGMWLDQTDTKEVNAYMCRLRKDCHDDL